MLVLNGENQMTELTLPKRIGSYLLLKMVKQLQWADLYLSAKGDETKIQDYVIVAVIKEWFSDDVIATMNTVANQLRGIPEVFLWHPVEFYYETPYGLAIFPVFNSFSLEEVLAKSRGD